MFEFINFYFIPGVVLGCIYALGAVGISLLFGDEFLRRSFHPSQCMLTLVPTAPR